MWSFVIVGPALSISGLPSKTRQSPLLLAVGGGMAVVAVLLAVAAAVAVRRALAASSPANGATVTVVLNGDNPDLLSEWRLMKIGIFRQYMTFLCDFICIIMFLFIK